MAEIAYAKKLRGTVIQGHGAVIFPVAENCQGLSLELMYSSIPRLLATANVYACCATTNSFYPAIEVRCVWLHLLDDGLCPQP